MIIILNIFIHNIAINCGKYTNKIIYEEVISEKNNNDEEIEKNIGKDKEDFNWYIEIPSINLKAPISETTNMEILENFVGHFEETSTIEGNVGLAGHNRGYKNNYFENINKLKTGDEIKYKFNEYEGSYYIEKIDIIKSTNWSYLENTKENKITLITCVENEPDLRLCIQAIQK